MSKRLAIHPLAAALPPMSETDYASLKSLIQAKGKIDAAIVMLDGKVLDGRHRARICEELGIKPWTREFDATADGDPVEFVYSTSVHRNQDDSQKAMSAAYLEMSLKTDEPGSQVAAASRFYGVTRRYVQYAKYLIEKSPKLAQKVHARELPLSRAVRQLHRETKRRRTKDLARDCRGKPSFDLTLSDCLKAMPDRPRRSVRLIVADPPYNIGIDYGDGGKGDRLPPEKYIAWCQKWMEECIDLLTPDGSMWVVINNEWAAEYVVALKGMGLQQRAWVKWYETFGTNCQNNFNRTSRHLLYFVRNDASFVFNADAVTRPSDRQKMGDKRAARGGKIWDDVWTVARLVDNAEERVPGFPTQIPLGIVEPIVASTSEPGDLVLDPFSGSGTTGHACLKLGRRYAGIEKNPEYLRLSRDRLKLAAREVGKEVGK